MSSRSSYPKCHNTQPLNRRHNSASDRGATRPTSNLEPGSIKRYADLENDPTEGMDPYEWMEFTIKTAQEKEGYLVIMPNSMDRKKILLGCDPNISDLEFVNFKRETMGLRPITDEEWDKLDEDGPAMVAMTHFKHLPNVATITFTPLLPGEKGKPEVSQVAAE